MPRLPNALLRRAHALDPLIPPLLAPCRGLRAAHNELRWLREHVEKTAKTGSKEARSTILKQLVKERASGKPLQYILGTEFFGHLEIRCRPGVLIPRQDTAASVGHLARLVRRAPSLPSRMRVLDLCTGTGCIPLLFHDEFSSARDDVQLRLLGVDSSKKALALAKENLERVRSRKAYKDNGVIDFLRADVLIDPFGDQTLDPPCLKAALNFSRQVQFWDIVVSNPPYISPSAYWKTTTRSVRHFEPKLALVPPSKEGATDTEQGDAFYPCILNTARDVEAKIVLLEVADLQQALRVARKAHHMDIFDGIEIWRDQPDVAGDPSTALDEEHEFPVIGRGNGRSVLCWRGVGAVWLGKGMPVATPDEEARRLWTSHEHALKTRFMPQCYS